MKTLFSNANEKVNTNSTGKTAFGLVFAIIITSGTVAGMKQQTGNLPGHWSASAKVSQPAPTAVAGAAKKQVLAAR